MPKKKKKIEIEIKLKTAILDLNKKCKLII